MSDATEGPQEPQEEPQEEPQRPTDPPARRVLPTQFRNYSEEHLRTQWMERYSRDWRYDPERGTWAHWDQRVWAEQPTDAGIHEELQRIIAPMTCELDAPAALSGIARRANVAKGLVHEITLHRHAAEWDADPLLLFVPGQGGRINLRTGILGTARRADYGRLQTQAEPCGDCPRWRISASRRTRRGHGGVSARGLR